MITLLVAEAAPHGLGPALVAPAVLAEQFSIGWSNDAFDAGRDAAAGRTDKPIATGAVSRRAVGIAAVAALAVSLLLSLAIGEVARILNAVMMAAGWAYNAGLKSTLASGLTYVVRFGLIPAFAASTLPGHPATRQLACAACRSGWLSAVVPPRCGWCSCCWRPSCSCWHRAGRTGGVGSRPSMLHCSLSAG
jgi:4-hydroxybenzoate polyprenyltransferase